jgi:hypothetical protein
MAGKIVDCSDKLVLCMGEDLIAWLQSPDWGRPLALGVVVVSIGTCIVPHMHSLKMDDADVEKS